MVLSVRAVASAESFATARGELTIWRPAQSLLVSRIRRHGESQFAQHLIDAIDALRTDRVHIFMDLDKMPTYDSDLRILLTKHFADRRHRIEYIDLVVGSKLVSMGVEVARLVLGEFLRPHTRRAAFISVLDTAIAARALEGFTSDVLRTG